jgi:hypothetical protein
MKPEIKTALFDAMFPGCSANTSVDTLAIESLRGFYHEIQALSDSAQTDMGSVEDCLPRLEIRMRATLKVLDGMQAGDFDEAKPGN